MWCVGCCPCWKGSVKPELEDSGLLTSQRWQSDGDAIKTEYYTVRRISSFGRAGSGEDVSDTGREQADGDIQSPAELWTAKIQRVQPEAAHGDSADTIKSPQPPRKPQLPHGRWRRALHPFRPPRKLSKNRERDGATDLCPPSVTVSSPELDINTAHTSPCNRDGHYVNTAVKESDATQIARTYGLDTSLYTPNNIECAPMSRSYEALNAWISPDTTGKADWLQEIPCGTVHFTAAYFQKNKKLLVHINRVENLPPKGEHYTYSVVVKLIILPSDKPVHVSRVYKNDLNPEIEEDFEFVVKHPLGKVLRLSLYDAEHQGKYDAIGHALFYLEDVMAGYSRKYAMRLYKQSQPDVDPGNIRVSLSYKREVMIMKVLVLEACNLLLSTDIAKSSRLTDKYNTYVKVVYFSCGQKMKSRRSRVFSNNRSPTYNEMFAFKFSPNFLHDSFIVVSVMMKGLLRKDVPIGRLVLGPFQYTEDRERTPWGRALLSEEEVTHWFRMYL